MCPWINSCCLCMCVFSMICVKRMVQINVGRLTGCVWFVVLQRVCWGAFFASVVGTQHVRAVVVEVVGRKSG